MTLFLLERPRASELHDLKNTFVVLFNYSTAIDSIGCPEFEQVLIFTQSAENYLAL